MVRLGICFYSLILLDDVYQTPMLVLLGWLWWPMLIYVLILQLVLRLIKGFDVEDCCSCHACTNSKPWCFVGFMCHLTSSIQFIHHLSLAHDFSLIKTYEIEDYFRHFDPCEWWIPYFLCLESELSRRVPTKTWSNVSTIIACIRCYKFNLLKCKAQTNAKCVFKHNSKRDIK